MSKEIRACLLNDSFPPLIDGVANAVVNYATTIHKKYGEVLVVVPRYPDVKDDYPFPVLRYTSFNTVKQFGYRAGYPFSKEAISAATAFAPTVIHSHCPIASLFLGRALRASTGAPLVCTYHTKFDIEVRKAIESNILQSAAIKLLVKNMEACDEVWVVSEGAGENLRGMGYQGDYVVMENGVDFPLGRVSEEEVQAARKELGLSEDIPTFMFVGRMMWYKGVRISLDALKAAKERGEKFRMILIGDGGDRAEIEEYVHTLGLERECIFTGAVHDREQLRRYFCCSDLFLFPSTFDTNGIVVREAAACAVPSVLIRESCASEGIKDGVTGYLIEETADSMMEKVIYACHHLSEVRQVGKNAQEQIYVSWETSVDRAVARYRYLEERYAGRTKQDMGLAKDEVFKFVADWYAMTEKMKNFRAR